MASHHWNKTRFEEMTLFEDLLCSAAPGKKCRLWNGWQEAPSLTGCSHRLGGEILSLARTCPQGWHTWLSKEVSHWEA